VLVCFVVLVGAFGAYAYALNSELSKLKNQIDSTNSKRTFSFFWQGPIAEKFNVTTFWMNITFQKINETHLIITVKINDLARAYVGVVFDVNHNGEIDKYDLGYSYGAIAYYIGTDNTTIHYFAQPAYLGPYREDSQRFFEEFAECSFEDLHTCEFDPELGYTYIITVNLQDVLWPSSHKEVELINDLIHVEYAFEVAVEFSFGMELIA